MRWWPFALIRVALALLLVTWLTAGCFGKAELGGRQVAVDNQTGNDYVARADYGSVSGYVAVPRRTTVVVAMILSDGSSPPYAVAIMADTCDRTIGTAPTDIYVGATVTVFGDGQVSATNRRPTPPGTPTDFGVIQENSCAAASAKLPASAPLTASPVAAEASPTPRPEDREAAQLGVVEAVNTDPVNFGGCYVEPDGTLVILYVGANAGRARVEAALAPGVAVHWQQVERSWADLMRILRKIGDRNIDGVVALSIDTINNQVDVLVSDNDPGAEAATATLSSMFGSAVEVRTGPPPIVH